LPPALILLGTFFPVIGLALTFVLAQQKGTVRLIALWAGPGLTLGVSMLFGKAIAYNGNMLFVIFLCLSFFFAIIYYPTLAVVSIIRHFKEPDE